MDADVAKTVDACYLEARPMQDGLMAADGTMHFQGDSRLHNNNCVPKIGDQQRQPNIAGY